MFKRHRSFSKALSFLCILSLVLSLVPPVGIWQSVKADDTTLYNGGIDSYNGQGRSYWLQQADKGSGTIPDKVFISSINKWVYFNCEIYAERRDMIVYGEPWDVPDNNFVWNFKEDPNGYFHKNRDGTGPRGWFRYAGYTMNGDLFPDKEFPNDGDGTQPVEYANVLTWSEISQLDNFTKSKLAVAGYDPSKVKDYQWDIVWKSRDRLKDLKSGQSLGELFSQFSSYTSPPDEFKQRAVFKGVDSQGSAGIVIVHRKNGGLWYRTYSGMVIKQEPSKLSSVSVSITLDSYCYLVKLDQNGSVLKYDPATNMPPSVNVFITGKLTDNLGSNGADPYYESLVTTRNDVTSYATIINYFKITHKDPETNKDITIDLKEASPNALIGEYVNAVPVSKDSNEVMFRTVSPGISISIPPNILVPGDNTVTISGKVRIYPKDGRPIDASNSASTSFTIKVQPKLSKPQLQLSVTPSYSEVVISNGQYNPSTIQHKVKPVKVWGMTVPAGWKVVRLDFVIDKDVNRVQSATTPDYSESYDTTATTITSFTQSKTFDYNTTYIQPDKEGTPAYYGKVRYVLKDPNGNLHESPWSDVEPTKATVKAVLADPTQPTVNAMSDDKITVTMTSGTSWTPAQDTVTIKNIIAKVSSPGGYTITGWTIKITHKRTGASVTVPAASISYNSNKTQATVASQNITINTSKDVTSEDFTVEATVNYSNNRTATATTTVSVPVEVIKPAQAPSITLSASPSSVTGGSTVTITVSANAFVKNPPRQIRRWAVYIRKSDVTSDPNAQVLYQDTSATSVNASRTYTNFKVPAGPGKITFVGRARVWYSGDPDSTYYDSDLAQVDVMIDQPPKQVGEVTCDGQISPSTAQATKNPFKGTIDPPTTDVQVGVSASISSTGGKTISKWEIYCNGDLIKTITGNNTSVSVPLGAKTYTVNNDSSQLFTFRAVVTFTDGTTKEGTDTEIFGAQQVTLSNNPPYIWVSATPKVVPQGDDVYITTSYYDPDAPLGDSIKDVSVTVTPPGDYFDGRLFWSSNVGSYTVTATVTDSLGLGATATDSFSVIPAIPQPKLYTFGTLKENRKVILDGSYSYAGSKRAQIDWSKAKWTITPATSDIDPTSIKTVEPLEGSSKLTCLFKEAGRYKVTLTLTNNYGNSATGTWYIEIKPDEPPVASYTCPTKIIRDPNDSSKATVQLTSNSYSPDNDVVAKHAWLYAWDSNNDGNFDDETWYALKSDGTWQQIDLSTFDIDNSDCGNLTTVAFKTNNVGKYEVKLIVKEEFGQETIPQFVTTKDRKSAQVEQIVEVINVAPMATLNTSKVEIKKVNITVLTDKTESAYNQIVGKLNQLKADLYPYGVYVNINSYDGTNTTQSVGNTEKAYSCGLLKSWLNYDFDDVIAASNTFPNGCGIGVGVKNGTYSVFRYNTCTKEVNVMATLTENIKSVKFLIDRNGFFTAAYVLTTTGNLYQCLYSDRIASLIGSQIAGPLNYQFILMGTGIQEIEILWRDNYQGPGPGFNSNTRGDFHSSIILRFKKSTGYGNVEVYKIRHHITDFWSSSYEDRNTFLFFGSWYYSPNYKTFTYSYDAEWSGYSSRFYEIYDSISPYGTVDLNNWFISHYTDYWPYFSAVLKDKYGGFCNDTIYDYSSDYPRISSSDLSKFVSLVPLYDYSTSSNSITTSVDFNYDPSNPMWVANISNWFLEEPNSSGWIYTVRPYSGFVQSLSQVIPKAVLGSSKCSTLIGGGYIDQNNKYSSFSGYYTKENIADMYISNADKGWINKSGSLVFRSGNTIYKTLAGGYPYAIGYVNIPVVSLSVAPIITNYKEDWDNYTIYVSDTQGSSGNWGQYFSFWSIDKILLNFMTRNNIKFFGVTPSTNFDKLYFQQQVTLRQLANATDGKLYDSAGNAIAVLDQALNDIKAKYTNPQITPDPLYVLADEEKIIYYPYWEDYENDAIINQRWRYEHDETVFDNSQGKAEFDSTWLNAPIEVFTKPGKYTVTFQVQDSPPPSTSDFDEYKLWSKLERQMILYVHRRPIADFTATYNKSIGKLTITDKSYDPDHQYNRSDKGIINWHWQYKTIDDSTWTDTTLANLQNMTLQSGKIYLIKLEVQDCDGPNGVGVWSKPKIAMIDLTTSNNPPVADFVVDSEILKGNQPSNLQDKSYDPDGDTITAWHWWIYNSDGSTNKDFGEATNNNISTVKSYIATMQEGSYRLSLQVKDSNNNYSAVVSKWFKVYSTSKDTTPELVNNPPTGTFTMTITDHRTRLRPQTTYSDPDGDPKNAEQWYIKFNGQTQYFDRLPDTLEEAGYTYDGTYEIGYRVQDNPTSRSTKLKPLWSNWYVQTYYISTPVTINAWLEKFEKRAKNRAEAEMLKQRTVKASEIRIGEALIVKAKTTGYVEKIEAWFDRVETTVKGQRVTKTITGYWEARDSQGNLTGTMQLIDLHTWLIPDKTGAPYLNTWSSDLDDKN